MSISLCMIVKDEEENLERCLRSVGGLVDEIVLTDTGSTDGTVAAAKRFGARVFRYRWDDSFSNARNFCLAQAAGTWILVMDADDELDPADRNALLNLTRGGGDGADIYCCKTLCYSGDKPDCNNALINMNVRLIRNGKGYRYCGRVHEQITRGEDPPGAPLPMTATGIRFHHYGYLTSEINKKEKHKRNIALIQMELDEDPENGFMLFNLGNEYLALGETRKALDYYLQSYRSFQPLQGYGSMLLTRIILCCDRLRMDGELFGYVRTGLRLYPLLTDFEYLKGAALQRQGRYLDAIRSYRKCIRMGTPPPNLNSMCGIATFKPHYALGVLYQKLGDQGRAIRHLRAAVRFDPACREALGRLTGLLLEEGRGPRQVKAALLRLIRPDAASYLMLSDLLYDRRLYRQALPLAARAARLSPENPAAHYAEGLCRFYLGQYRPAYRCLLSAGEGYASRSALFRLLCLRFDPACAHATPDECRGKLDAPYGPVIPAFLSLLDGRECAPLSDDPEESKRCEGPIFGLLEILLRAGRFDEFLKAVQLLNLISDGGVLLRLGKLYYKYGYAKLAFHELTRSIRLTDRIDAEGLAILGKVFPAAAS